MGPGSAPRVRARCPEPRRGKQHTEPEVGSLLAIAFRFVLAGGSLKEMGRQYGVSYPTVRNRLDDFIEKLKEIESARKGD